MFQLWCPFRPVGWGKRTQEKLSSVGGSQGLYRCLPCRNGATKGSRRSQSQFFWYPWKNRKTGDLEWLSICDSLLLAEYVLQVNISNLFIAGSDTTANTIRWCVLFLLCHPKVQEKLQAEVDSVVGSDRLPSLNDRDRFEHKIGYAGR